MLVKMLDPDADELKIMLAYKHGINYNIIIQVLYGGNLIWQEPRQ